jgi:transcriptional antiterminator NusG
MSEESEGKWYAIYTYSGKESRVKANLQQRIKSTEMEDKIFDILIPSEEADDEEGDGKKKQVLPGYVLIKMLLEDDSWYIVHNTPGVIDFASAGKDPVPVSESEIRRIKKNMGLEIVKADMDFEVGDKIRVTDGVLEDHVGEVEEIDYETEQVKVSVSMFGRNTPVDLEFDQVEKT